MKTLTKVLVIFMSIIALTGCATQQQPKPLDPANLDTSVIPGNDFFQYANGSWIKNNPIPDEYSRYGAFEALIEKNYTDVHSILEKSAQGNFEHGSIMQKIGDFYATGMEVEKIEEAALQPLQADLDAIAAIQTAEDVQKTMANFHKKGVSTTFFIFAASDDKNSSHVIAQLYQGGLGLPDRDYYLNDDGRSKEIRDEYVKHLVAMFKLMGDEEKSAQKSAETVMAIETQMAEASMSRLDTRDPHKTYNKTNLKYLDENSVHFDWPRYFSEIGKAEPGEININQPDFFKAVDRLIKEVAVEDWKTYLRWNLINEAATYLGKEIDEQNFKFYGTVLSGQKAQKERWKRVLQTTSAMLPEALGQEYVKEYFPPEAKDRMLELVGNLKLALGDRINNVEWMGAATKEKAQDKLAAVNVKIGYPDKWIDYTPLEISRESYMGNIFAANEFEFNRMLDKMDKPVDRGEWHMSPQTVNAYYNPSLNEIVFPAAILQYPFFNMQADDAVNYGAIGMVIGHEMTHGFDDQGRQFDKNGNLVDWWTEKDAAQFKARTQILVDQYNKFSVFDTLHVDGELTLGENIADLGGMNVAWDALMKAYEKNGKPEPIDGFTPEQRFFLGYAQVWRQSIRDEELMRRLKEDVHSPGNFRVNGPVVHLQQFYDAFDVQPEQAMYYAPENRAFIW